MDEGAILIVEDNPADEMLIRRALKKGDITNPILVARDGAEALELIGQTQELPVLVLMDLRLPKMSGIDVLRRLRQDERTRLLPVVVLTSSNEAEDRFEAYMSGANSFVQKPVDYDAFIESIASLGLYWLRLNQPAPLRKTG